MATAYENLVTHLKLAIRQLRELVTKTESSVYKDELPEFRVRSEIKHPWAKGRNGEMQLAKLGEIGHTWTQNFLKAAKCLSL